jgi:FkbM family methyltransferase
MTIKLGAAALFRRLTSGIIFRKRLPAEFGGGRFYATSRADIRILQPGLRGSGSDLLLVADRYIKPGDVVWDIGSNLGILSWCAAWKAGSSGRVFSLEADYFYAELQHRTAQQLSASYAPVVSLCAAAAKENAILELAVSARGHARNHLVGVADKDRIRSQIVKSVVSVSGNFLSKFWPRPDFVKIDIEGAELLFLSGATELLESQRPVMYIEVSDSNQREVTQLLHRHDYKLYRVEADREVPIERCEFNTLVKPA